MKYKMSATILLISMILSASTYSRTGSENKQIKMYEKPVKQHSHKTSQKYLNKLSHKLKSELDQIEDPREKAIVKKLVKNMQASSQVTQNIKTQYHINKSFKNTILQVAENLTSPHAVISISIATTLCAINGILNSSIALQIIHELVSAYKWGIASKFTTQILSLITFIYAYH